MPPGATKKRAATDVNVLPGSSAAISPALSAGDGAGVVTAGGDDGQSGQMASPARIIDSRSQFSPSAKRNAETPLGSSTTRLPPWPAMSGTWTKQPRPVRYGTDQNERW